MEKIALICALKPHKGEEWSLTATKAGLLVSDQQGEAVTLVPNAETPLRIKYPSFWASISYLVVVDDAGEMLSFEPKKATLAAVREMVAACQGKAGSAAVTAVLRTAVRDAIVGTLLFIVGVALTFGSFVLAQPGGTFIITRGLIAFGVLGVVKGLYGFYKALKIKRSLPAEEDDAELAGR
jgi:hypothetical protein